MNFMVMDLEFNQAFDFTANSFRKRPAKTGEGIYASDPSCPSEIIQIGVVMLDGGLDITGQSVINVSPTIYKRMHPIVARLTGIHMGDLLYEKTFPEVYEILTGLTRGERTVLCTWGSDDIKELYRNINYHQLNNKTFTRKYINVQRLANSHLKNSNTSIGLKTAVERLDIPTEMPFHHALNDAVYTALIFKKLYNENIEFKTFDISQLNKPASKQAPINLGRLYEYAKRRLGRTLTDDEKNLAIKLYNAGRTKRYDLK